MKLSDLAAKIREIYCDERRKWESLYRNNPDCNWGENHIPRYDGGVDEYGRKYTSAWEKIARFCLKESVNPVKLIKVAFSSRTKYPPDPNHLFQPGLLKLYRDSEQKEVSELLRLFEFQKERYIIEIHKMQPCKKRGWTAEKINRAVLGDPTIPLSALFRYCIAFKEGYRDIAERFRASALLQYLGNSRGYDIVWKQWIPDALKQEAEALSRQSSDPAYGNQEEPPSCARRNIVID